MTSLSNEHRRRAELASARAATERAAGNDWLARRHDAIADAYEKSARILDGEPLQPATPRRRMPKRR